MPSIRELLEVNRKSLLELSTRNRLLSIPKSARSARTVRMHDELTSEVWRILVDEKKEMSFVPAPHGTEAIQTDQETEATGYENHDELVEADLPQPEDEEVDARGIAARHSDKRLQTLLQSEALQKRLLNMYYDARTFIEEQGVNILYLALGQLRWFEASHSEVDRYAPLILIPVKLERKSAAERFYVSWLEEDAQENLSLAAKLKAEFGIDLPPFPSADEFEPETYLNAVAEAVAAKQNWKVLPNAMVLGFFSFAKFLMYRDLDAENWPEADSIEANPFIQALLRDGFPAADHPIPDDPDFDVDEAIPVERLTHVVDADSSQALAIEAVRQGRDLVIQGPPGTGKSQTITNLIAAAVADGKTVLFVAEKLAALEVVKRRLDREGVGDIALELHSNKTQKRAVLSELKRVLERGRLKSQQSTGLMPRLSELRRELNAHAAVMNDTLPPSGLSIQQVIGHLVRLKGDATRYGSIVLEGPQSWTTDDRKQREAIIRDLASRIERSGPPATHPWRGVMREAFLKMDRDRLTNRIEQASEQLATLLDFAKPLALRLAQPEPHSRSDVQRLCRLAEMVAEAPVAGLESLGSAQWETGVPVLQEVVEHGRKLKAALDQLDGRIVEAAWSQDFAATRMIIAAKGKSPLRFMDGEFRSAFALLKASYEGSLPKDYSERLAILDAAVAVQTARERLAANSALAADTLGSLWASERTDWAQAKQVVSWVEQVKEAQVGEPVRNVAARVHDRTDLKQQAAEVDSAQKAFTAAVEAICETLNLNLEIAFGADCQSPADVPLSLWSERLAVWRDKDESLSEWTSYLAQSKAARELGLTNLVDLLETGSISAEDALKAFDAAYYEAMFRAGAERHPQLSRFDGESHSGLVAEFRSADKKRIELARLETLKHHSEGLPQRSGVGAIGILQAEMQKKRNLKPLRRLIKEAGAAIQAIKPVFMMSPLSIAQYLEPGTVTFDLLLIDEASQVEPVDAFGAIARSKQIVVVGDDKQLPPTRFFTRMTSNDTHEDEDEVLNAANIESILGLCVARGLPQAMLRWHYRSRHQSLIAVSNRRFYDSKLFIVPSPYLDGGDLGLKFNLISDGVFDRGGTAQNRREAKAVAEAVVRHVRHRPTLSLGVAAFSLKQAQCIRDELEILRRQNKDLEAFFAAHADEPFFVKNLENVQGDERDVIFISVGYGKDTSGYMTMTFGPLNSEGGERRLNVLISRAKRRCEVFSSITADDIDLARARGAGVAALKAFLSFAETGTLDLSMDSGRGADSPFEEAVKSALEAQGYDVRSQVGIAGFFIDLAIVDAKQPGRYLLGIECDGAAYHSSRAARDRDRLRQQVLEDHGWAIHRIWSTDWFNRPQQELRKVISAIDAAATEHPNEPEREPEMRVEFEALPAGSIIAGARPVDAAPLYEEAQFPVPTNMEPHLVPASTMAEIVGKIVAVEGPIHREEIVARVRLLWGLGRAGSRIQNAVKQGLRIAKSRADYQVADGFWRLTSTNVVARDRSAVTNHGLRRPDMLAPEEIGAAILDVVRSSAGATADEIPQAVARRFGFGSTSAVLRDRIESEIQRLQTTGKLIERGSLLVHADSTRQANGVMTEPVDNVHG